MAEKLVDNGCFSEIIISADMFQVHMPGPYLEACSEVRSREIKSFNNGL